MPLTRLERVGTFVERVRALGDRLGPLRITVQSARDEGLLAFLQGSLPEDVDVAYDFRHESWDGVEGIVRVNDFEAGPFRYIRLREPPYDEDDLVELARRLRRPAYVYFRHEDEATAPDYARRLLGLIEQART
jgi:uncharacterized protein YecE (DUF72 family)